MTGKTRHTCPRPALTIAVVGCAIGSSALAQDREPDGSAVVEEAPGATLDAGSPPGSEVQAEGEIASAAVHAAGRRELGTDLYVDLQVYAWIPFSVEGDSTVAGLTVDLSLGPDEVFDLFNGAFSFRGELWRDRVGGFADFQYVRLGQEGGVAKIEIDNLVFDFGVMYRATRAQLTGDPSGPHLTVDLYGGGRLQYLDQEITLGPLKPSGNATWIGPLLGARFIATLSDDWALILRGDVGGFAVNADRDLNWSVLLGARWQFADNWDLRFGYRAFGSEYLEEQGTPRAFGQDLILHGPYVGAAVNF